MIQRAQELCEELKSLGSTLLSVLEKKDAEALAQLRAAHEVNMLEAVKQVKKQQVKEAHTSRDGLEKARIITETRQQFYDELVRNEDKKRIKAEIVQIDNLMMAKKYQLDSQNIDILGAQLSIIPNIMVSANIPGPGGSIGTSFGGSNLASAAHAESRADNFFATMHTNMANMASIQGSWQRRDDEWKLELDLATKELEQIDKQIRCRGHSNRYGRTGKDQSRSTDRTGEIRARIFCR